MTPYHRLKAADPDAMRHLLEAAGHTFTSDRAALVAWCRRAGIPLSELDEATRAYRDGISTGQRTPHINHW